MSTGPYERHGGRHRIARGGRVNARPTVIRLLASPMRLLRVTVCPLCATVVVWTGSDQHERTHRAVFRRRDECDDEDERHRHPGPTDEPGL